MSSGSLTAADVLSTPTFCSTGAAGTTGGAVWLDNGNSQELLATGPQMSLFPEGRLVLMANGTWLAPPGWYLRVQNQDYHGPANYKVVAICTSALIFAEDFESGDCSAWAATTGGC